LGCGGIKMKSFVMIVSSLLLLSATAWASPSVQCWGNNAEGQTSVPTDLKLNLAPAHPIEVRTGRGVTCALDKSGTISCWGVPASDISHLEALTGVTTFGLSSAGACAITGGAVQCFSSAGDSSFEQVPSLTNPISVQVGALSACAQDAKGIQCWGGSDANITSVPTFSGLKKYAFGGTDACALDKNGMQCWGDGNYGLETPPALSRPTDFFMGNMFVCAFDAKGLECWGSNSNVSPPQPAAPTIPNPSTSTQYVSGQSHVCGLSTAGVQCWGDNSLAQLDVPTLSHPSKLFADPAGNQTCALDDTGIVCWGEDQAGQSSLGAVSSISAGVGNTCVTSQGNIECWGSGSKTLTTPLAVSDAYQVAIGSNFACTMNVGTTSAQSCWGDNSALQAASPGLPTVDYTQTGNPFTFAPSTVTSGYMHACVYESNNPQTSAAGISCFGNNDFGQTKVPSGFLSLGNVGTLSAGGYHTCGIDLLLGLQCWGKNEFGESTVPTTLKNPRQVSAGFSHTCALDDNGVTCWGRSTEGQTAVPALSHPRSVQAGGYHTCAIDDSGVTCWGENAFGQTTVPTSVGKNIANLTTGLFHTCAVTK
jgi:alpha-tubulin suppressor-like RCC1 family protein